MSKKTLVGGLALGSVTLYLYKNKDYAGEAIGKLLDILIGGVGEKTFPGISQTEVFNYYMEKMHAVNNKLGTDIITLSLLMGIPIIIGLCGYLIAEYLSNR